MENEPDGISVPNHEHFLCSSLEATTSWRDRSACDEDTKLVMIIKPLASTNQFLGSCPPVDKQEFEPQRVCSLHLASNVKFLDF